MPSVIDQRIASRLHQRQIEAVLRVEGAADRADVILNRATERAISAIVGRRPLREKISVAADQLRGMVAAAADQLESDLFRVAAWSHAQFASIIARNVPRRWLRLASPLVVYAGEDVAAYEDTADDAGPLLDLAPGIGAQTPTEPVVDKRLSDEEWQEFVQQHVFPQPTAAKVRELIERPTAGLAWRERFEGLSKLIRDPEKLAGELATGFELGENLQQLSKRIGPMVDGVKASARRIARTEGLRVVNEAQREQYAQLGSLMAGVQVLATLDENTRPHHAARNGRVHWQDGRREFNIGNLPVLPDEPNCRCWDSPILKPPRELANDPALRAQFTNDSGASIPDPSVYDEWFARADVGRRKMAVGAARYNVIAKRLGNAREPEWTDFIDGKGKLVPARTLAGESVQAREARRKEVQAALDARKELLRQASATGFAAIAPSPPSVMKAAPAKKKPSTKLPAQAPPSVAKKALELAKKKIREAPVPSRADIIKARKDLASGGRAGGESRGGSAAARRKQRQNLFAEFGGGKRGYIACPWTGIKMHWTDDAEINPNGYPKFERGKIFTKWQGGGYQLPNLIPESFRANRSRGDKPLRKENMK